MNMLIGIVAARSQKMIGCQVAPGVLKLVLSHEPAVVALPAPVKENEQVDSQSTAHMALLQTGDLTPLNICCISISQRTAVF